MLKAKKCDIKPFLPKNMKIDIPYSATKTYFSDSLALVTKVQEPYLYDMSMLKNRKIAVLRNLKYLLYFMKTKYPYLKYIEVDDIESGLNLVQRGEVFGFIHKSLIISYAIQRKYSNRLKIIKTFNKFNFGFGVLESEKPLLSILNKTISSIKESEKQKIFNKWIVTTIEKEPDYSYVWQLVGGFIFVLIIVFFFYNRQRKLKNSLSIMVKDATKELEEKNKNMHTLLNTTMEAVVIFDEEYNVVEVNQAATDIFGSKDILGINIFDFVPEDEQYKTKKSITQKSALPYEIKLYKKNRSIFPALVKGNDIVADNKKYRIITVIDLTDIKDKEKQLLQQSKLAQMGDMISMIAHQWRQPLNAISATGINLSLLSSMKMLEDAKVQKSSEFIQEQCQKMSATIDTFMNFVKPAKESKPFKLIHAVEAIMQIMGTQLANHNIKVNIESTNDNISIVGHEDLLEQVIINLLSNARDAFEEQEIADKFINITIDMKNDTPIIIIEDNAGGIPQDIEEKIFNPYFTTKEQGKGTGIGLYMSMDIMRKSFGGDLVYSATDGGSRFEVVCGK